MNTKDDQTPKGTTEADISAGVSCAAPAGCVTEPAWMPSHREEVISALWFIAAFVALDAGCPRWVFVGLFIKAGLNICCAIQCAIREWWSERSHNDEASNVPPTA